MTRFITALLALAALAVAAPAGAQEIADITAQPDRAMLEQWKADGVTTVVNMRTPAEMAEVDYDEQAAVEALGMRYVALPFDSAEASPEIVDLLAATLDGAEGPVALHCRSGSRAANALAALQIERGEAEPGSVESPAADIPLVSYMMRKLSPLYAEAARSGDCATC